MNRAVQIAKMLMLLAAAAALLAFAFFILQLREDIDILTNNGVDVAEHFSHLEGDLDDRVNELKIPIAKVPELEKKAGLVEDAALDRVKDLQPVEQKAGSIEDAALQRVNEFQSTIAETHSLLYDSRASVAEMNRAALAERKYFEVQIPETTEALNAAINGLKPVEDNAAATLASWSAISGDARNVADKETADFLKPMPWYMKPVKRFGEIWDIVAAVARHAP